jgi:uncharacterized protein with ParB-like and HNH nuclease domain
MQTGKSTVKDIFDGTRIFNIPIYQRAYAWEKENLEDFFSDIVNQQPKRKYFLGSFLFHLNGKRNEFTLVDIVDGQQRLTTFVVFINELIHELILKNSEIVSKRTKRTFIKDEDVFKLELSNEDSSFLHNYILADEKINDYPIQTPAQKLLVNAKTFFSEKLKISNFDKQRLEEIYNTITDAEVLIYVVKKINTATQIFELLNDRGKKLSDLESIKSFLMYNISFVSSSPDQLINNIQQDFARIYRLIEKHNLNEDDILRYHTIAFEHTYEKPKKFIKEKILRLLRKNKKEEAKDVIRSYPSNLFRSFGLYVDILLNKDNLSDLTDLFMIGRIAPFFPLMMNIKHSMPERFPELINNLQRFTFRASLAGLRSNGETHFIKALWSKGDPVKIISDFIEDSWWNINNRAAEALNFANHYEWLNKNVVRYILFKYENYLRREEYSLLKREDYFKTTQKGARILNIEHITAQKVKDLNIDETFQEEYLHSFGNLVIDYLIPNIKNSNKNTSEKLSEYNLAPLMSKNEINNSNCNWEDLEDIKVFIEKRELKILEFVEKEFGIKAANIG